MSRAWKNCLRFGSILTVLFTASLVCQAADDQKEAKKPAIDPKAAEVLRALSDYYGKLQNMQVEMTAKLNIKPVNQASATVTTLKLQRPNRLSAVVTSGQSGVTLVSDGKELITYVPALKKYTVEEAPKTLDEVTDGPLQIVTMGQGLLFVTPLLATDPYKELLDGVDELTYLGVEELEGVKAHHLKFVEEGIEWQLWVDAGKQPLVLRVAPDMMKFLSANGNQLPDGVTIELAVAFGDWKTDIKFADDDFKFMAPKDAEKVESLFGPSQGPHPLKDQPAPDFTLDLLKGGKVKLSSHKDKEIVILDFWATWCGPCVKALPEIAEVAKAYQGKGVAFYAVNIAETSDEVLAFLKAKELDVPVALDKEGEVASAYKAEAIPQTVLVGRDGVVHVVHVGVGPNIKKQLTAEIEALLAGKKPDEKK